MKYHSNNRAPQPQVQKQCFFCTSNTKIIDYKDADTLKMFMTPQSKIQTRKRTGLCASHQRLLARAVKRARVMAIVPFTTR